MLSIKPEDCENIEISFFAGKIVDNKLLFYSELFCSFFIMDIDTKMLRWLELSSTEEETYKKRSSMKEVYLYKNRAYFWSTADIGYTVVDLDENTYASKTLKKASYNTEIVTKNESVLIISTLRPWDEMWEFNMETEEFIPIKGSISRIKEVISNKDYIVYNAKKIDDTIFYPVVEQNIVVTYDISNKTFDCIKIPGNPLYGVATYNRNIYFSRFGKSGFTVYDVVTGEVKEILNYSRQEIDAIIPAYARMFVLNNKIIAFPGATNGIITYFDLAKEEWTELMYPKGFEFNKKEKYLYTFYGMDILDKYRLLIFQLSANMMLEINTETGETRGFRLVLPDKYKDRAKSVISKYGKVVEGIDFGNFNIWRRL